MINIEIKPGCSVSIIAVLIAFLYCETVIADVGENIAKGAAYTFKPAANYALTKDLADKSQLTDGVYVNRHFWSDKRTVGWQASGLITVEIDIEQTANVDSVCISTVRGDHAGVSYPDSMMLFLSTDKDIYKEMGDIYRSASHNDGAYKKQKYCVGKLATEARYILIVIQPKGKFTFIDEIEVLSGSSFKFKVVEDQNVIFVKKENLAEVVQAHSESIHKKKSIFKLISYVSKNYKGLIDNNIQREINLLKHQVEKNTVPADKHLNGYMSKLFEINRMILRKINDEPLVISVTNPWEKFTPVTLPNVMSKIEEELHFDMVRNGAASGAIVITNNSDIEQKIKIEVRGAEGVSFPVTRLYEVMFVTTSSHDVIGDPLKPLNEGYITLMPGQTKQIWLSVNTNNVVYGDYKLDLLIKFHRAKKIAKAIPLHIKVWPVLLPQKQNLYVNTWSYLNWRQLKNNIDNAINDLYAHHANVAIVHPDQIPWPDSPSQNLADYNLFDKTVERQFKTDKKLFFMHFNDEWRRTFKGKHKYMSAEWKQMFSSWITQWVVHMKSIGLDYQEYAFYPVDEPDNNSEVKILIEIAKLLKDIDPEIRVYTTLGEMSVIDIALAKDLIDIYQVLIKDIGSIRGSELKLLNKEIWLYSAEGGGKNASPHEFYRLQAWEAFREGVTGIGFWAYADTGNTGSGWNDFDGRGPDYSVVYESDNSLYSSKRWEAWREGIEDNMLLVMAREKISSSKELNNLYEKIQNTIDKKRDYQYFELTRRYILLIVS